AAARARNRVPPRARPRGQARAQDRLRGDHDRSGRAGRRPGHGAGRARCRRQRLSRRGTTVDPPGRTRGPSDHDRTAAAHGGRRRTVSYPDPMESVLGYQNSSGGMPEVIALIIVGAIVIAFVAWYFGKAQRLKRRLRSATAWSIGELP